MPPPPPAAPARPFTFDTVFDGDRVIPPVRPQTAFSAEELARARQEGEAAGRADALVRAEEAQAAALQSVSRAVGAALEALARVAHEHRVAAAGLALACGRAVAAAALERFPEAALEAAFESLAEEMQAQPRLTVHVSPAAAPRLGPALEAMAARLGHAGALRLVEDAALAPAAFSFDWGDGRCRFDPAAATARVEAAVAAALAVEGLHAEPPPLGPVPLLESAAA